MEHKTHNTQHITCNTGKSFAKQNQSLLRSKVLRDKRGFSLMEVLVVVSVVVVGLLGVSSLSSQNVQVQNLNDEELIASMLAQEGIELTRNIRDWNWINLSCPTPPCLQWATTILGPAMSPRTFIVDNGVTGFNTVVITSDFTPVTKLFYDGPVGNRDYYVHNGAAVNSTKYYRYVETSFINDSIKVLCHVNWRSGGRNHGYDIEAHLYDWR